ncbi:MAG TPA: sigma-70 family RNA polymerase sigma factor [Humisphaera sp.]
MTDSDLVQAIRAGDPAGFPELVRRYSGELYALACSLVGNAADAEDVLQQAFVGALRGIGRFQGRSQLRTWLYSIVANQASKARRSRRVRQALSIDAGGTSAGGEGGSSGGGGMPTVRSPAPAVDGRLDVDVMLDALSPEHREVIVLRELQNMTYDEIAAVLKVPRGTVESRLFRARRALKERFAEQMT